MAWTWGFDSVYFLAATLFQAALVIFILATGRVGIKRGGIALILGISAFETVTFLVISLDGPRFPGGVLRQIDTLLLVATAYLLTLFPTRWGSHRAHRWIRRGLALLFLAWIPLGFAVWRGGPLARRLVELVVSPAHELAFVAIAAVLAVWFVPQWTRLARGPLRGQALLAGSGLAITVLFRAGVWSFKAIPRLQRLVETPGFRLAFQAWAMTIAPWFAFAALARLAWALWRRRDPETGVFAGLLVLGVLLGVWFHHAPKTSPAAAEVASQVLRPLLLAGAMLRYDLFKVPDPWRRALLPVTAISLAGLLFSLLVAVLTPQDALVVGRIPAGAALLAVAILAGFVFALRRPLARTFAQAADPSGDHARLSRYRLALERVLSDPRRSRRDLSPLRSELGVTEEEHAALVAMLDHAPEHATGAVRGPEVGDVVANRYEVVRELGVGGQGRALLARDGEEDELVVLKQTLRPWEDGARRRRRTIQREAERAEGIDHPNVARVIGTVEDREHLYLVREYVPGRTLDEILEAKGRLDPEQVERILTDLAAGLAAIHERSLVHGDLKPGNVVLDADGHAVLIDLGTVRLADEQGGDGSATATMVGADGVEGTVGWMAPEQITGDRVDERSDLFTLGALGYRLLTGEHHVPLEQRSRFQIERAIVDGSAPTVDGAAYGGANGSPEATLVTVIEGCLARDPDARPGTAASIQEALDRPTSDQG